MVARSAVIAMMEAGYANSSNRTGFGQNVFQVHGIDDAGQAVLKRKIRCSEVLPFFAGLDAALVGIEACHTAHYWGREIAVLGTMSV
jgi:hypothetical protein